MDRFGEVGKAGKRHGSDECQLDSTAQDRSNGIPDRKQLFVGAHTPHCFMTVLKDNGHWSIVHRRTASPTGTCLSELPNHR